MGSRARLMRPAADGKKLFLWNLGLSLHFSLLRKILSLCCSLFICVLFRARRYHVYYCLPLKNHADKKREYNMSMYGIYLYAVRVESGYICGSVLFAWSSGPKVIKRPTIKWLEESILNWEQTQTSLK